MHPFRAAIDSDQSLGLAGRSYILLLRAHDPESVIRIPLTRRLTAWDAAAYAHRINVDERAFCYFTGVLGGDLRRVEPGKRFGEVTVKKSVSVYKNRSGLSAAEWTLVAAGISIIIIVAVNLLRLSASVAVQ
jgi:Flp pilus assembly pilin Flp